MSTPSAFLLPLVLFYTQSLAAEPEAQHPDRLVGYTSDPKGRGTPSLLITCLLTLIICVWSALHLNVPPRSQTIFEYVSLNVRWVIAGIYAPEMVVFTAWRQWCSARLLQKIVLDCSNVEDEKELKDKPRAVASTTWSMTHSFFACTGGFAFEFDEVDLLGSDTSSVHDREAQAPVRLTLTARGVALLAKCGHLPRVPREEIEDKSKANDLAKAIFILQATWMLVQVAGRLAARLPVTLLEINTVAHVLCAFTMFWFWWYKPLLPGQPIIIQDKGLLPLAAFMYSSSEMSGYMDPKNIRSQTMIKTLFAHLSLYSKIPEFETLCLREPVDNPTLQTSDEIVPPSTAKTLGTLQRAEDSCLDILRAQNQKGSEAAFFERRPRILDERPAATKLDERRWEKITEALDLYPFLLDPERISLAHDNKASRCLHFKPEQFVVSHVSNWPGSDLLRDVDGLVVGMILWTANFMYGGIHAAAWNDHFPSQVEMWMWRASASYIGFCGGLWMVLNFTVAKIPKLNEFLEHWADGKRSFLGSLMLSMVVFICGSSLIIARVFVVVEAFIGVREMPASAYVTPEWTDIFPHY